MQMIKGSIVDLITPFDADGAPDFEAVEVLVDWQVSEGSAALVVGGSRASSPIARPDERTELLRRALWQADGRIPVLVGIQADSVQDAIDAALDARAGGVHFALLDLPAGGAASQDELLGWIEAIAKTSEMKLIVRGVSGRSTDLAPAGVARLAQIDGVVGYVECSADSNRVRELMALGLPKDFALYSGHDASARESMLQGFSGGVSVTANVAPRQVRELYAAALSGDRATSEILDAQLHPLYEALLSDANSDPVKWALVEMGRIAEGQKPPSLPQSSDYSHLRRALRSANVLG